MHEVTDWIGLWNDLVIVQQARKQKRGNREGQDVWNGRAGEYDRSVKRRWSLPDSSRDLIEQKLHAHPNSSVLDIGAGTGAWTIWLAERARLVTAVEPSPAMLKALKANVAREECDNVGIKMGSWPDVLVKVHDFSLCSHSMYGSADFSAFIQELQAKTRRCCFLILRAPTPDGVMARAAKLVWGHPYDSPNFQVAYNALVQMGIFANVLMEDSELWRPWSSSSLTDALHRIKRRLNILDDAQYDDDLMELLEQSLVRGKEGYAWPAGLRSALVYWEPAQR